MASNFDARMISTFLCMLVPFKICCGRREFGESWLQHFHFAHVLQLSNPHHSKVFRKGQSQNGAN